MAATPATPSSASSPKKSKATKSPMKSTLQKAQKLGRGRDTILAHITPEEAALLKARGGAGTINPRTGLREYEPGDASTYGGSWSSSDDSGSDDSGSSTSETPSTSGVEGLSFSSEDSWVWGGSDSNDSSDTSTYDNKEPTNTGTSSGLTFEQQMALEDKKLETAERLAEIEKEKEAAKLQAQIDKQEAAGTVAGVNVDQKAVDILNDPEAFLTQQGGLLSGNIPTIDANAEGTTLSDATMDTGALAVEAAQGTAASATGPTQGATSTYEAADPTAQVAAQAAEAQRAEVREQALVDAANAQVDMQGVATGRNKDGSINETGIALSKYAALDISNVIDTSTTAGKEMARQLGEGNYVDYKSTVQGQLDILSKAFVDASGNPKIPSFASGVARNVSRIAAFKGVTGTAATAAMTTALMESMLPIAQADAKFFQTVQLKNLDNKQQQTINTANVLSKFELTNQDARMTAAITNAKTFMQYDLTNLANEQQVEVLNTQNRVQAILETAKEENVARRFAAQSQNDMDMFYDNLSAQVDQFNVAQQNAMTQFNVGEENSTAQFNATLENNREQFYKELQFQIDAANAEWRRTVTLTETEMEFEAAALDVKNIINISTETLNQLWDRADAQLDYIWKSSENALDRETDIELAKLGAAANRYAAQQARNAANAETMGLIFATAMKAFI